MKLYRAFFEGKGWGPDRLNALTPKQLGAIAGEGGKSRTFGSIAEAADHYKATHGAD